MKVSILRKKGHEIVNLNRRKAIREKCLQCSAWSHKEVTDCPLYLFRSGSGRQNSKERAMAIRSYCLSCMNGQRYEVKKCVSPDCALFPYRNVHVDRSAEIKSLSKIGHIEVLSGRKNERQ